MVIHCLNIILSINVFFVVLVLNKMAQSESFLVSSVFNNDSLVRLNNYRFFIFTFIVVL